MPLRNRPSLPDTPRTPTLVRLSPAERATLQLAADRAGVPLSTYMREVSVRCAARLLARAA